MKVDRSKANRRRLRIIVLVLAVCVAAGVAVYANRIGPAGAGISKATDHRESSEQVRTQPQAEERAVRSNEARPEDRHHHDGHGHDHETHSEHRGEAAHAHDDHGHNRAVPGSASERIEDHREKDAGHDRERHNHKSHVEERDAHEGHDHGDDAHPHDDQDEHDHTLKIAPEDAKKAGIELKTVGSGDVEAHVELPGEIALNEDKVCHVVPHVSGTIVEARSNLGDKVSTGDVIAVIDSRELAEAKSRYLVFLKREELAQIDYDRTKRLWEKRVSTEKEHLDAQKALEEAKIERLAAAQKLFALGLTAEDLEDLTKNPDAAMMRYSLTAPFDGVVISKHMSKGEWIPEEREILCIADLSDVWVNVIVYPNDLQMVRMGQTAIVKADASGLEARGTVSYIDPLVGEESRTALARIVLPNLHGAWRPGLFVTVRLLKEAKQAPVAVENSAIQLYDGAPVVFVHNDDGFEAREINLGLRGKRYSEVKRGLAPGERYASTNSFVLKAELRRSRAVCGHSH